MHWMSLQTHTYTPANNFRIFCLMDGVLRRWSLFDWMNLGNVLIFWWKWEDMLRWFKSSMQGQATNQGHFNPFCNLIAGHGKLAQNNVIDTKLSKNGALWSQNWPAWPIDHHVISSVNPQCQIYITNNFCFKVQLLKHSVSHKSEHTVVR